MVFTQSKRSAWLFLAAALLIFSVDFALVRTMPFAGDDLLLAYAVLADFILVIPFIYWLVLLRKTNKSITKVFMLPLLGAVAAWLILPVSMRNTVWNVIWPIELLVMSLELFLLGYEIRIAYRVIRRYRQVARSEADLVEAMRISFKAELGKGKFAAVLLHDFSMIYHLLFSWKRRTAKGDGRSSFSYHRKSSQLLYTIVITKMVVFEGVAVHLLVQQWSHWAAWILTAADVWLLALLWADWRASQLHPVRLESTHVRLRYGLRIQADVPLHAIAHVESAREYHPDATEQNTSALPLLATPNVRIALKEPMDVEGILFLPRSVTSIYVALDEPDAFVRELRNKTADQVDR